MEQKVIGKDLTKEPPRSPNLLLGGYPILGRTLDKCRALLAGNIGEYHFDCPLDNTLFGWKRILGDNFKAEVATGASDEEMVKWLDTHGRPKTDEEKKTWSVEVKRASLYNDPATATLFDWLDADDKASFAPTGS